MPPTPALGVSSVRRASSTETNPGNAAEGKILDAGEPRAQWSGAELARLRAAEGQDAEQQPHAVEAAPTLRFAPPTSPLQQALATADPNMIGGFLRRQAESLDAQQIAEIRSPLCQALRDNNGGLVRALAQGVAGAANRGELLVHADVRSAFIAALQDNRSGAVSDFLAATHDIRSNVAGWLTTREQGTMVLQRLIERQAPSRLHAATDAIGTYLHQNLDRADAKALLGALQNVKGARRWYLAGFRTNHASYKQLTEQQRDSFDAAMARLKEKANQPAPRGSSGFFVRVAQAFRTR